MPDLLGVRPSFSTGFAQWPGMSEYPQLWTGLVGAWDASLGQTGSMLIDWSGKGNHGTLLADTHWVPGALDFDGDGDYVTCGSPKSADFSGPVSLVAWVYPKVNNTNMIFISGQNRYTLWVQSNNEVRFADDSADGIDTAAGVLTLNKWNHIVGTFSGVENDAITLDNTKIYINAISKGDHILGDFWTTSSLGELNIGRQSAGFYMNGLIDTSMIYNRALISAEIALLHQIRKQLA